MRTPTTIAMQALNPITLKTGPALSGPARYAIVIGAITARYSHQAWREKRISIVKNSLELGAYPSIGVGPQ
jgi:hypothetical protein